MNIKNVIEQNPNLIESVINAQSGEELMALLTEKGIQVDLEAASKLKEYINKAKVGELTEEETEQFQRIADSAPKRNWTRNIKRGKNPIPAARCLRRSCGS